MRRTLFGTRQHVQSAQNDLAAAAPVPLRQLERPLCEGQMDGNPHHLRHRPKRRPAVQQVFVPISNLPVFRRGRREAGQRERRSKHVLPKARVRIFRIERIDQQRIPRLYRSRNALGCQQRRPAHLGGNPTASDGSRERVIAVLMPLVYNTKYFTSRRSDANIYENCPDKSLIINHLRPALRPARSRHARVSF